MSILDTSTIRLTDVFKSLMTEFSDQHFALLSAWQRVTPDKHGRDLHARMQALNADLAVLGHKPTLVAKAGKAIRSEYLNLDDEEKEKLSDQQLYEPVPFYLVINTETKRAWQFDHDMQDLGVKYEQQFVIFWNGTNPANREGYAADISNVKEEYRREVQNFPA